MAGATSKIDLGFTEPFLDSWRAKCKYMPCKVGGRPAFLALAPVLGPKELTCSKCTKVMRFLLQLYAPVDTTVSAFHRTLFLFACGRSEACSGEYRLFRSQLPKVNRFYSDQPPDYDASQETNSAYDPNPETFNVQLCPVCGISAPHRCGKCQKASYCSREHQLAHWKIGGHKETCGNSENPPEPKKNVKYPGLVFSELELIIGDDNNSSKNDDDSENDESDVTESEMSKYQDYLRANKPSLQNENIDAYSRSAGKSVASEESPSTQFDETDQLTFERFKKLTKAGEVVRYRSDWYCEATASEDILWISSQNQLESKDIPVCEQCGAERRFEFQILPQLLNDLLADKQKNPGGEEHLDWGTLLVFSCPKSCQIKETPDGSGEPPYVQEFIYNQPA